MLFQYKLVFQDSVNVPSVGHNVTVSQGRHLCNCGLTKKPLRIMFRYVYRQSARWQRKIFGSVTIIGICLYFLDILPKVTSGPNVPKGGYH
jgi:hypothetical protein